MEGENFDSNAVLEITDSVVCDESNASMESEVHENDTNSNKSKLEIEHYVEIFNNENGEMTTRLVTAGIPGSDKTTIVPIEQLVNFDISNLKVYRCQNTDQEDINENDIDISSVILQVNNVQQAQYIVPNEYEEEIESVENDGKSTVGMSDTQYVQVVEKDSVPLVYFTSTPRTPTHKEVVKQTSKQENIPEIPKELMESPKFKAYIYSCKQCDFKCNAIKELTAHRLKEHSVCRTRNRQSLRPQVPVKKTPYNSIVNNLNLLSRYCPLCSYTTASDHLLRRHLRKYHDIKRMDFDNIKGFTQMKGQRYKDLQKYLETTKSQYK